MRNALLISAADSVLLNTTQKAVWVTNFGIELPWAGLDEDVCKYTDAPCRGDFVQKQRFRYPIEILKLYPAVSVKNKCCYYTLWFSVVKRLRKEYL